MSQELLDKIDSAINTQAEPGRTFLRNWFEIARHHGCRLLETHLNPMTDLDIFKKNGALTGRITFLAKGRKVHTVPLHPALIPMFQALRSAGKTETYAMPKSPAKEWLNFLTRCGVEELLPGACFHSLRVTVATKLARAGVSEKKAMAYVGHASSTVHQLYVRLRPDDLTDCLAVT